MKTLILFTDAWHPQVNGVVTTLSNVIEESKWDIKVVNPSMFKTFPCPKYPEIPLSLVTRGKIIKLIKDFNPDYVHISTEGPIGIQAFRACKKLGKKFTSSYHTKFPEYVNTLFPWISTDFVYNMLRRIHLSAEATLIPTKSVASELRKRDICKEYVIWGRGVDISKFRFSPDKEDSDGCLKLLYVGRISKEKNIEAFLDMEFEVPVEFRVVGKGPYEEELKQRYCDREDIVWVGEKKNTELVKEYQDADVFVFPSKTDTFGLVMLEAMATGTPVVGYHVDGPKDIIIPSINGYIAYDNDLVSAVENAIGIPRRKVHKCVSQLSWREVAKSFEDTIERANK